MLSPEIVRDRQFTLRMTGEEYEQLNLFCRENSVSKSSLMRKLLSEVIHQEENIELV